MFRVVLIYLVNDRLEHAIATYPSQQWALNDAYAVVYKEGGRVVSESITRISR